MTYREEITVEKKTAEKIIKLLTVEPKSEAECFGENDTLVYGVKFANGYDGDIKICGVQYEENSFNNLPWTEMVLFDERGYEITMSEVSEEFFGMWALEYNGDSYIVDVKISEKDS